MPSRLGHPGRWLFDRPDGGVDMAVSPQLVSLNMAHVCAHLSRKPLITTFLSVEKTQSDNQTGGRQTAVRSDKVRQRPCAGELSVRELLGFLDKSR